MMIRFVSKVPGLLLHLVQKKPGKGLVSLAKQILSFVSYFFGNWRITLTGKWSEGVRAW